MKNIFRHSLALAALAAVVSFSTVTVSAQDSERAEQRRIDRLKTIRDQMDVKSEPDWKEKIEPLVVKVQDAQRARGLGAFGGFGGGGRVGPGGQGGAGGGQGGQGGANRNANPEFDALRKAMEDKAPADEIKEKLAKYRESKKAKDDALTKAQDDLRKALSPRQEAGAVIAGLLN